MSEKFTKIVRVAKGEEKSAAEALSAFYADMYEKGARTSRVFIEAAGEDMICTVFGELYDDADPIEGREKKISIIRVAKGEEKAAADALSAFYAEMFKAGTEPSRTQISKVGEDVVLTTFADVREGADPIEGREKFVCIVRAAKGEEDAAAEALSAFYNKMSEEENETSRTIITVVNAKGEDAATFGDAVYTVFADHFEYADDEDDDYDDDDDYYDDDYDDEDDLDCDEEEEDEDEDDFYETEDDKVE